MLLLDVGYGDGVTSVLTDPILASGADTSVLACAPSEATKVLVPPTTAAGGITFCVTAGLSGLGVRFALPEPYEFLTPANVGCTGLPPERSVVSVVVRLGRAVRGRGLVYGPARAVCGIDAGFLYALAVETQNNANFTPVKPHAPHPSWGFSVPWNLLRLGHDATSVFVTVNEVPVHIPLCINPIVHGAGWACERTYSTGSVSADIAPLIRLQTPAPSTGAAPPRLHDVEFNGTYNYGTHNLIATSFAQNQSAVSVQRALSQALSLAPVTLPMSQTKVVVGQDLQSQSQSLFAFQSPSTYLEDTSLKPYFDVVPFSVTKLSSLAAGAAYGYTSELLTGGIFYGLQGPRVYSAGASITVALATPPPVPTPTPLPTPSPSGPPGLTEQPTAAAPEHRPLEPPPPPAPFLESATQSTRPLQVTLLDGYTLSGGTRDTVAAMAFEGHVFGVQSPSGATYRAETVNLFGRLERDFRAPALAVSPSSLSQFLGESATFTAAATKRGSTYFQLRETVAVQLDDPYFAPTVGSVTWLAPLDGPVAHLTASAASSTGAKYVALDLFGFRLTNVNGDLAAQAGWQISLPLPQLPSGWILSGGSETQTISDRLAATEQGLISTYASAVTQVLLPATRPQRLGNVRLDTPELSFANPLRRADPLKVRVTTGYDFGTVTACGTASSKSAPTYQCLTAIDQRFVGGAFFQSGKLEFGATDTAVASGAVSAADVARNLGTSGALPGSTTAYITYDLCPQISIGYTNAAFPSGVPLPQQGATLSGQVVFPVALGALQPDLILGYFNERDITSPAFNQSGFSAILRVGTTFRKAPRAACN